jgi:peptidoglycan/xylan/chitin deacetylase (PgdA/CDA1 family)/glycosyltransferase involved in cell wall biosynthesis
VDDSVPGAAPERLEAAGLPFVSVVIPSYNRRESLAEVLAALGQQTYPAHRFEVVVVLDGSADGSREMLELLINGAWRGRIAALWQPNQGAGRARNRGAAAARGDVLVFLDDDVVPGRGLLEAHARAHAARPGDVVLGRLRFAARGPRSVIVDWEAEWYERHFGELARPDYAFGCWDLFAGNVSLARRDFLAAGGFDEAFTSYGCEDWELGLRLLKSGRRFRYCGDAVGVHHYAVDVAGWLHHAYWDGRSEVRFARKHPEIKHALQLGTYYQGSGWRRLGRRLFGLAPRAWPPLVAAATRLYLAAEHAGRRRSAARLAKLVWAYHYWSGMRDELGGAAAVDRFVGFRVPVLAYHRVTARPHPALAEYAVSPATFRRQLAWLRASGHRVVSLHDLYAAYRGAAPLPRRAVAITFDDGYEETATAAAPILREFGYPATVFVVSDRVGGQNDWDAGVGPPAARLLDWEQLRELAAAGMEIGGHSATHARLPGLPDADLAREVGACRAELERRLSAPVRWFAYPHGEHDDRVRRAAREAGYLAGLTFDGGLAAAGDDLFALRRIPVGESDGVVGFAGKLTLGEDPWTALKRRTPAPLKGAVRKSVGWVGRVGTRS